MNYYQDEMTAEYNQQKIQNELKQIRLAQFAIQSRSYKPGRFERTMFNFAKWMISTGKQLGKRYEVPATNCNHWASKGFAH